MHDVLHGFTYAMKLPSLSRQAFFAATEILVLAPSEFNARRIRDRLDASLWQRCRAVTAHHRRIRAADAEG